MKIKRFVLSEFEMNSYLLIEKDQAILIDAGASPKPITDYLEENKITLQAILLTHTHLDHIAGLSYLREKLSVPVFVEEHEQEWLQNPDYNGSKRLPEYFGEIKLKPAEQVIKDENSLQIGSFTIQIIRTPGHTPGGISYYIKPYLFTGDTLFYRSIGRTDLFGGNYHQLLRSIKNQLLTLPTNTTVLPGHGEKTSIGEETKYNPFLSTMNR